MNRILKFVFSAFLLFLYYAIAQQNDNVICWWKFDDSEKNLKAGTEEFVSGAEFNIVGLAKYVPGVKGSAIKFDGFSSYVEGTPKLPTIRNEDDEEEE